MGLLMTLISSSNTRLIQTGTLVFGLGTSLSSLAAITADFDASFRLRTELKRSLDFDDARQDYTLLHSRVGTKLVFSPQWSLIGELQDAQVFDEDAGSTPAINPNALNQPDADDLDIHRLSLNYQAGNLKVKLGRQKLNLGDQRLVASLEWVNTARVHDGLRVDYEAGDLSINAFVTELVSIDPNQLNDGADTNNRYFDSQFNGAFLEHKGLANIDNAQAWFLQRRNSNLDDDIYTLGLRLQERVGQWIADAQASLQTGDFNGNSHQAASAHISFTRPIGAGTASLGLAWASGDSDPQDNRHETFDNLYPLNHAYYGFLDLVALQNVRAIELNYKRALFKDRFKFRAALHGFWLDDKNDAWYQAGLLPVAGSFVAPQRINNTERFVGSEVDLTVQYDVPVKGFGALSILAGYSRFFVGDRVEPSANSARTDDADFVYLQVSLKLP